MKKTVIICEQPAASRETARAANQSEQLRAIGASFRR
jgi:hypothetical protein